MIQILTRRMPGNFLHTAAAHFDRFMDACPLLQGLLCFIGMPLLALSGVYLAALTVMYPLSVLFGWV